MSNFIEYKDKIAFHPGYYIKELVDDSGLTKEDFAKRLDTTPKNLSILVRGEQSLSIDLAMKLSRLSGTTIAYWLNLQKMYDAVTAEFLSDQELEQEKRVFGYFNYQELMKDYGLKGHPRDKRAQIEEWRECLKVSTLSTLTKKDMAVSFRSSSADLTESSIVKANAMVQIATNRALQVKAPQYDRKKFEKKISIVIEQTTNHQDFYPIISKAFMDAGVILEVLPNISGSKTNGATKKIGKNILLMVNDRRLNADTFWFTLFHEIGHILNGDFGISFEEDKGSIEEKADLYAQNILIDPDEYAKFLRGKKFDAESIRAFASKINRDPGIVLGRLQTDKVVGYTNKALNVLRHKYKVVL